MGDPDEDKELVGDEVFGVPFGRALSARRKAAGLSQEELGIRAGLHRTEIGMLERGDRLARVDSFVKVVGALGCSFDELLEDIVWEAPPPKGDDTP